MNLSADFNITAGVTGQAQLDKLNQSVREIGKSSEISAGQTRAAMRTLPAQFTDIVTQLAGGQSPGLILLQQGGQIKDSFGGIVPAIKAISTVLTPMRLLVGGVAGSFAALGYAAVQGALEVDALNKSLALTGNFAATSAGQVEQAVQRLRAATNATAGNSRDLLTGVIGSGAFGPGTAEAAATAMARIQKLSGQTSEEVVKDFTAMTRGVASWAAEHNRQYHYLTAAQFQHIQQLEKQGRVEEALKANIDALNTAFKDRTVQLGYLETAWSKVKDMASSAWDAMKGIGKAETAQQRLENLQKKLERLERIKNPTRNGFADLARGGMSEAEVLREEITELQKKIALEKIADEQNARAAAKEQERINELNSGVAFAKEQAFLQLKLTEIQNNSARVIQTLEMEQTEVEALQRMGLISGAEYNRRKNDIEARALAEKTELVQQEIKLEQSRGVRDQVDAIAKLQKLEQMSGQLSAARAEQRKQAILAAVPPKSGFSDAIKEMETELAKLMFQADHVKEFGDKIYSARAAMMAFETGPSGKFAELTGDQKTKLLETAKAIDTYTNALQQAVAGIEYEKQTKMIEANTRALGESNLQRDITIALQELENKGIKEGTELYTQLAERRIEALTKAKDAQADFTLGVRQGMNDYLETVSNKAGAAREAFGNAMRGMEDALVNFTLTGKLNFADMAKSIIADIARIYIKQSLIAPLMKSIGGFMPGFGGGGGGGFNFVNSAGFADVGLGFARGGAFDGGGVRAFANGDVVNSPTLFKFAQGGAMRNGVMGEAGPEAIMPLRRGPDGKLGVAAGGGGSMTVNVTVNADTGATQGGDGPGMLAKLGNSIAGAVRQEIINQKRPGGLLAA